MKTLVLRIDTKNISPNNELRARLIIAQSELPSRINFDLYEMYCGDLSKEMKDKVQNVWLFKTVDEQIIKNWERIAKEKKIKKDNRAKKH